MVYLESTRLVLRHHSLVERDSFLLHGRLLLQYLVIIVVHLRCLYVGRLSPTIIIEN